MADLIDRNALRKTICAACSERLQCTDMGNVCFEVACINNAPTIEAEPIRRGRWIKQENGLNLCSACGVNKVSHLPFCGHCGARMDGGENG